MTETVGAESVIPATDATTSEPPPDNPAWSEFLGAIPQSMHDMVRPHLRKWDEGVNSRIQSVHGEYADFRPFKDAGIGREVLEQSYGIYRAINEDPRKVYDILAETYGYNVNPQQQQIQQQPGVQPQNQGATAEYELGLGAQQQLNPEVAQLKGLVETMAQIMLAQNQAQTEAKADAELDQELSAARAKHGDFDERIVLAYMQNGMAADQAVQQFLSMRNDILAGHNRPGSPNVISGSGPLPSQQINPAKLNTTDTRALVANMMKAANQQGV